MNSIISCYTYLTNILAYMEIIYGVKTILDQ